MHNLHSFKKLKCILLIFIVYYATDITTKNKNNFFFGTYNHKYNLVISTNSLRMQISSFVKVFLGYLKVS